MTIEINLLPKRVKESKLIPYFIVFAMLILIVGIGFVGYLYFEHKEKLNDRMATIDALKAEQVLLEQRLVELQVQPEEISTMAIIEVMKSFKIDIVDVINQVEARLPIGGHISNLSLSYPGTIAMTCFFEQMDDAGIFLRSLRQLPFTQTVTLSTVVKQMDNVQTDEAGDAITTQFYVAMYTIDFQPVKIGGNIHE